MSSNPEQPVPARTEQVIEGEIDRLRGAVSLGAAGAAARVHALEAELAAILSGPAPAMKAAAAPVEAEAKRPAKAVAKNAAKKAVKKAPAKKAAPKAK